MLIKTTIKKIGNSYYVLIPMYFVSDLNLKEDDKISIDIQKKEDNSSEVVQSDSNNDLEGQLKVKNDKKF